MSASISQSTKRELDELRASIRAELDTRTVGFTPKDDTEVGEAAIGEDGQAVRGAYRVFKARTIEQDASVKDGDAPFDIMDWIDGFSSGDPTLVYETTPNDSLVRGGGAWEDNWYARSFKGAQGNRKRSFAPAYPDELAALDRQQGADTLRWLHRDESDASIMARFASTPDERVKNDPNLSDEEKRHLLIELEDGRNVWRDKQIALRRKQLHLRLTEWFGTAKYSEGEVVVGWAQRVEDRKFVPLMGNVLDWIRWTVDERGELAGFASCAAIMKKRLASRKVAARRVPQSVAM